MKHSTSILAALALSGFAANLASCSGSTEAAASCQECPALAARIAALELRATTTEGLLPSIEAAALADALIVVTPVVAAQKSQAQAIDAGLVIGTLVGFVAPSGDASTATATVGSSTAGYLFVVPGNQGADETVSVEGPIYFEGPGCSGRAWVAGSGAGAVVSDLGARTGFVFRVHAGPANEVVDAPGQYWAVPKGSASEAGAWVSKLTNIDDCQIDVGSAPLMFAAVLNDPLATGIPSGPFGGKVELGGGN